MHIPNLSYPPGSIDIPMNAPPFKHPTGHITFGPIDFKQPPQVPTFHVTPQFATHVRKLFVKPEDTVGKQLHAAVGVSGEAGELLDAVKKTWIYGKPLDLENVLEECGDLLFYIEAMLQNCGLTMEQAMTHNYHKLKARYPDGYTDAAAIARADKVPE